MVFHSNPPCYLFLCLCAKTFFCLVEIFPRRGNFMCYGLFRISTITRFELTVCQFCVFKVARLTRQATAALNQQVFIGIFIFMLAIKKKGKKGRLIILMLLISKMYKKFFTLHFSSSHPALWQFFLFYSLISSYPEMWRSIRNFFRVDFLYISILMLKETVIRSTKIIHYSLFNSKLSVFS